MKYELYHHGVQGQKWGIRRTDAQLGYRVGENKKQSDTNRYFDETKKAYKEMQDVVTKHRKAKEASKSLREKSELISKQYSEYKAVSDKASNAAKKYIDSLPKDKAKKILIFDGEHGNYGVDAKIFNPNIHYDDMINITEPGTGRNVKYESIMKHSEEDTFDELYHHGVQGQKWGIRRTAAQLGHFVAKNKKRVEEKHNAKKEAKKKEKERKKHKNDGEDIKKMSDEELRAKVKRLELERDYRKAIGDNSYKFNGKKFVGEMLENSAKNIGTQATTYAMGKAVNSVFGENIVNPKKGQKD